MCKHESFQVEADVTRITEVEGGPVTGYRADIKIHCTQCFQPFKFIGVDTGYHFGKPTISLDEMELRAPIEPIQ